MGINKTILRSKFIQQRCSLPTLLWRKYSDRICTHLQHCPQFTSAKTILAYQSCRQEPDLTYLFDNCDRQWGLARCVDRDLLWHSWEPSQSLLKGAYGILEPAPELPQLAPENIDLILVPAVAIDRRGYRLGYGGGYYDRLRAEPVWGKIPTIGIVFDFAYVDELPIEHWDLPIDTICTESGCVERTD